MYGGGDEALEILQGNEEIFYLLSLTVNQLRRAGIDGIICGLDYGVIIEAAKGMGIEAGRRFFEKLHAFESEALRIFNENKRCDTKQKERCRFEFGEFFEWACKECKLTKHEECNNHET